jgi:hypothetical protein
MVPASTAPGPVRSVQRLPRAYLHLVTKLLVDRWPQTKLRELLPDRLASTHPEIVVP